ncbi:hypothetical protein EU528_06340 [Candidatus Thorarchaeota archaeon]|nr:MAG: hypothetical protein EU528_06340 [Candidatus Thorarchaeota archaeon]
MTGQIPDQFLYEGEAYDLVGLDGGPLYEPQDFGITPQMASTACWRGYQMFYDCKDGQLILDHMHVRTDDKITVNDISPRESGDSDEMVFFNTFYENLGLKTKFTGSMLLAKDFISEMYVHMGFQSPDSFKTVLELQVQDGDIIKVRDLSDKMEERRKQGRVAPTRPETLDEPDIEEWVKDRFSLDYKSE